MKHLDLFSGEGGFALAAHWMGWKTMAWCEWDKFCQQILEFYFPEAEGFGDIDKSDFTKYENKIDILTGGFPCQPFSNAGNRLGTQDPRHKWPRMLEVIGQVRPRWVVGENVRGLISWSKGMVFDKVQADLEAIGYEILPFLLPACAINAPHRRDRIWFVAHRNEPSAKYEISTGGHLPTGNDAPDPSTERLEGAARSILPERGEGLTGEDNGNASNSNGLGQPGKEYGQTKPGLITEDSSTNYWENFPTQSPICSGDDGFPPKLDGITFPKWRNESIKAHGNAIVPQVALQIFKAIEQYETQRNPL